MYPKDDSYTDKSWFHPGRSSDEWNDEWRWVGWHDGWEENYDESARSLSPGSFDLGAKKSPKRFEWVKVIWDTGAAVNTCPIDFAPHGAGDGSFYRTASG